MLSRCTPCVLGISRNYATNSRPYREDGIVFLFSVRSLAAKARARRTFTIESTFRLVKLHVLHFHTCATRSHAIRNSFAPSAGKRGPISRALSVCAVIDVIVLALLRFLSNTLDSYCCFLAHDVILIRFF